MKWEDFETTIKERKLFPHFEANKLKMIINGAKSCTP
jgi:hypothetical protein